MDKIKEFLKKYKNFIIFCAILYVLFAVIIIYIRSTITDNIKEVTYNEFKSYLENNEIDTIYYNATNEYIKFTLFNNETKGLTQKERSSYTYDDRYYRKVLNPGYDNFKVELLEKGVNVQVAVDDNKVVDMLGAMLMVIAPVLLLIFFFSLTMKGQFGNYKEKDLIQTSDIKFENVIGQDEILEDIKFIVELIKNPKIGKQIGAKTPKGVLLSGDPGTGKTLIAKAIAGEADVPFISMNGSDFKEMYVGLGAKRVRDLFKVARENAPCIVFIDEIDAIGASRANKMESNQEDTQTINALLKEMDGFSGRDGIFILAATNHPEKLDAALKRAGRFDRQVTVNPPRDWKVRKQLLDHYLEKYTTDPNLNTENLAKQLSGFTGADIAMICNEASIVAMMKHKSAVDADCMEEAIDKKLFNGNRSKKEAHKRDQHIIAYHEAGHAIAHFLLGEPISRATIAGTTSGVGGVVFGADTDTQFRTKQYYENRVIICYAGRASEEIKFNMITQGASSDITQASKLLYQYVSLLGFEEEFGLLDLNTLSEQGYINKNNSFELIQRKSKELYAKTLELLKNNYDMVEALAYQLLQHETLSGQQIIYLMNIVIQNRGFNNGVNTSIKN